MVKLSRAFRLTVSYLVGVGAVFGPVSLMTFELAPLVFSAAYILSAPIWFVLLCFWLAVDDEIHEDLSAVGRVVPLGVLAVAAFVHFLVAGGIQLGLGYFLEWGTWIFFGAVFASAKLAAVIYIQLTDWSEGLQSD